MANNVVLNPGAAGSTIASEQNGAAEQYQIIKIIDGTAAAFTNRLAITSGSAAKVDGSAVNQPVVGPAASGGSLSGNPVRVGLAFNSTQPTVTTGQVVDAQGTARGGLIVATGTDTFNVTVNTALAAGGNTIGNVNAIQSTAAAGTAGWPVTYGNVAAGTAAWTSATAGNTALTTTVTNYATVAVGLNATSTMTGGVLTFEADDGSGTWFPITGVLADGTATNSTFTLSVVNKLWQFDVAAFTQFRVRLSTTITGSGTANLRLLTIAAPNTSIISIGSPLPTGTNVLGHVIADSGSTTAVTGNVTVIQGTGTNLHTVLDANSGVDIGKLTANQSVNLAQVAGGTVNTGNGTAAGSQRVSIASDNTAFPVNANAGTNLNTSALALETGGNLATIAGTAIAQEATTSGVKGVTVFGAVTTAKPTYTTAKSDALSLDVNGLLRVSLADTPANGSKLLVTPDSVALPANQSVNVSQIAGNTTSTATTGVQKVGVVGNAGATVDAAVGSVGTNAVTTTIVPPASGNAGWQFKFFGDGTVGTDWNGAKQQIVGAAATFGGYVDIFNPNTTTSFVQIFNKTSANVTLGTTVPDMVIPLPGIAAASATGSGRNVEITQGIKFSTGLTMAVTTTVGGLTAPANKCYGTILYN